MFGVNGSEDIFPHKVPEHVSGAGVEGEGVGPGTGDGKGPDEEHDNDFKPATALWNPAL
jgi:hypothetical protein